uniref:Eyes absent homolog n=1 Tax=Meloidogyne hapla TaxID=6305 RepID=A0A1I8BFA5_MELHA
MPSRNPYWTAGHEWDLAAMAMGRSNDGGQQSLNNINSQQQLQQQQQQNNAAYYGQMIAAASATNGNAQTSAWYPTQNYASYYGLGGVQRVGAALNGYLGSPYSGEFIEVVIESSNLFNCFKGVYASQAADYYNVAAASFPGSYYAAAASSAKAFAAVASQYGNIQSQQHPQNYPANFLSMNNKYPHSILMDQQSIATGSELDTSPPLGTLNNETATISSPPLEMSNSHNNGNIKSNKSRNKGENKCGGSSLNTKRSKKKKISAIRSHSQELNQTRVFVWELEDICSILPQHNSYKISLEQMLNMALTKLLEYGFNLDNFDDFDQSNIMDAQMDEALQNAANNSSSTLNQNSFSDEINIPINDSSTIPTSSSNLNKQIGMSATDGLRKLAEKCRNIRDVFERYRDLPSFAELLERCGLSSNELLNYLDNIEKLPEANIALYRDCLSFIHRRSQLLPNNCVNVILSFNQIEGGVAGALGRLMLCRMSEYIEAENVFCITRNGREAVLERLINQFQKKLIVLITTNEESRKLAEK